MPEHLKGKSFLVTGATEGIGKAAARHFASRGADLTLVGRNPGKTARLVEELRKETGNTEVRALLGDLSSLAEVRRVAAEFRARSQRLDVLVNNAGAVFQDRQVSVDGLELTFALDHLSYFLLTVELLGLLRATPRARVVSTSSGGHAMGKIDLQTIATREHGYTPFGAYCDAKLANILFTRELARRLQGTGGTANCFHPGWVASGFALNNPGLVSRVLSVVAPVLARTPEKGADTLIWLATSPEAAAHTGEYFSDREVTRTARLARDSRLAGELWALSERLCGLAATSSAA